MERRGQGILRKVDKPLLILYVVVCFIGLFTIYSSSFDSEAPRIYDFSTPYGKQLFWIGISLLIGGGILLLDVSLIQNSGYIVYSIVLLLLVVVLLMPPINGARSWFVFGGVSIQPSEFAKFATSMCIAQYLSAHGVKIGEVKTKFIIAMIIAIPGGLILLQPDAGTLLVFVSFLFVMYREGLSGNVLLGVFFGLIVGVISLFVEGFRVYC